VVEILEQGAVSFLAVPRDGAGPLGPADVERLFVVLAPEGHRPLRRISVGRHRLPDARRGQRFLAHVDRIAASAGPLTEDVRARRGGHAGRVLGVGRYALARHRGHVHLAYALARACARGELAASLGVAHGASFVLSVFRRSLPPTRRPRTRAPLAPATPERLDVLGAEVTLVAGTRPGDARLGAGGPHDRVGDALVGALLRRGPRPRVAWWKTGPAAPGARRERPAGTRARPAARHRASR
jgi:hypothetical protein